MLTFAVAALLATAAEPVSASDLVARYRAPWADVDAIAFNVRREVRPTGAGAPLVQEWRFVFREPDRFIVRSFRPPPQRELYGNGEQIWEYLPLNHRALRTDISAAPPAKRRALYLTTIAPYNVPFFLLHDELAEMPGLTVEDGGIVEGRAVWRFRGRPDESTPLREVAIDVDKERLCPVRAELVGKTGDRVQVRHTRPRELRPGLWLPTEIAYEGGEVGRFSGFTVSITGFELNPELAAKAFDFQPPPGVDTLFHKADATSKIGRVGEEGP
jgi:outer membrane lipoprotein-sorting protein